MKALIFDLDGTLLNTIKDLRNSTNFALQKFGFSQRTLEEILSFVGNGLKMLIKRALPQDASELLIAEVLVAMKQHYAVHCHDKTVPYEGIIGLLQACRERRIPMAIVSNKADAMVKKLRDHFFAEYISVALGESDGMPRKPAPDMVYAVMEMLGVKDAYFVGDSEVDVQTAKNAGLPCLAVSWGFRTAEQLKAAGAEQIFDSPASLLKYILN